MLITPSAQQAYKALTSIQHIHSVLSEAIRLLITSGIEVDKSKTDSLDKVFINMVIYKLLVDTSIYTIGNNKYYNYLLTDSQDTQFAQLYIIVTAIVCSHIQIEIPIPSLTPLLTNGTL